MLKYNEILRRSAHKCHVNCCCVVLNFTASRINAITQPRWMCVIKIKVYVYVYNTLKGFMIILCSTGTDRNNSCTTRIFGEKRSAHIVAKKERKSNRSKKSKARYVRFNGIFKKPTQPNFKIVECQNVYGLWTVRERANRIRFQNDRINNAPLFAEHVRFEIQSVGSISRVITVNYETVTGGQTISIEILFKTRNFPNTKLWLRTILSTIIRAQWDWITQCMSYKWNTTSLESPTIE